MVRKFTVREGLSIGMLIQKNMHSLIMRKIAISLCCSRELCHIYTEMLCVIYPAEMWCCHTGMASSPLPLSSLTEVEEDETGDTKFSGRRTNAAVGAATP